MAVDVLGIALWGLLFISTAAYNARVAPDRPQCSPDVGERCVMKTDGGIDEYHYVVNGLRHMVSFTEGGYFIMKCEAAALGDRALPAFTRPKRFQNVTLAGCAPPPGSYAAALAALNVTRPARLILAGLPRPARLAAAAFAGLPQLRALELSAGRGPGALELARDALGPLALRSLALVGVRPPALPPRLDNLRLRYTGLDALPPEARDVVTLEVVEEAVRGLGGPAPRLEVLTLRAPVRAPPEAPRLRRAALARWQEAAPGPWRACPRLEQLSLMEAAARALPAGFVAACPRLEDLELQMMQAEAIPEGFLLNATALKKFKAAFWPLKELPVDLFDYSPNLEEIDLSSNGLESLPSGLFSRLAGSLRVLSLARNRLHAAAALQVAPLAGLRRLYLADNPLGDLCPAASASILARSASYLAPLRALEELVLSRAGQARVCADWTHHMPALRRLDLSHNRIAELQFADLKIQRTVANAEVELSYNPLHVVRCSREDYELARDEPVPQQSAKIIMDSRLECTCREYWLALALREGRLPGFEPRCAAAADPAGRALLHRPLRAVPPAALVCALPAADCARNCSCVLQPALGGLRVECRGPELPAELSAAAPVRRLRAAGLRRLPPRLPPGLEILDLSDGALESATAEEAAALFAGGARVRLAGNPLRCHCDNRALLEALDANKALVLDYANTTCGDGTPVAAALEALGCARLGWAGPALAALCAAALAAGLAAVLLARPETRLRLKAFLHSRGVRARWLARRLEPADDDREYDAFVAHAAADRRLVAERLAPRLEAGGRRLCLYYRDWPIGAWIPTQIDASVRRSRRTLALVTPAFLRSRWARAELRAAHAAALRERSPRVVLLLAGGARLDDELRALAAAHVTLRWGARGFWDELRYALPEPRPPGWQRRAAPEPDAAPPAAA